MPLQNALYRANYDILPEQMVPLQKKLSKANDSNEKTWGQNCLDALETIGKSQYNMNLKLIENYEMVKGRFIFNHYFQAEGYQSMISELTKEFELPNYLRHYDIIGQVINTMSGEWQKRPDLFKVRQMGEAAGNEYLRTKQELTENYVYSKINAEINRRLLERGIDVYKTDFSTPEEAAQYKQGVDQLRQQMTPLEIQKYMDTDFLTQAEIWGQNQYEYDKEALNLPEIEKVEFEDMMIADRCFRHFFMTPTGNSEETWNPVNVFFHKSPDVRYIEDGDYVGRIFNLSINAIIDRYGYLMDKEDIDLLKGREDKGSQKWNDSQFNWVYDNYLYPFKGYPAYDIMKSSWNVWADGSIPFVDQSFFERVNTDTYFRDREGFYFVTEGYWKTQKRLFKITYIDEELGEVVVKIVDDNYIIPDHFVESKTPFADDQDINTYVETWINEVWKGIKINTGVDKNLKKDLYLAIGPNEFQFKGDNNMYGAKLPVCGQVFSVRNSRSMSVVDRMKPFQIGHNVAMNQLYQLAEKEVGMFVIMDVNMFPNSKDWGGEDSWGKWMLMAKTLGLVPADTSPKNISGSLAATGGFLPKVMDLNLAAQMVSRMNMAVFYEQQALKQVGFNDYRLGDYGQSSTATGVEQGAKASYTQTESYFTDFSNYLRRCHQMRLSMAQYVQSQKENVTITYIKSDLSRAFIKVLGVDLLFADLGVFVSNSQEHNRQLEMMRQFALENNTSGLTPVNMADIIMMNSPGQIRRELVKSFEEMMKKQQEQFDLQRQQLEQEKILRQQEIASDDNNQALDRQNKLDVEYIKQGAAILNSDNGDSAVNDRSEEFAIKRDAATQDQNIKRDALNLQRQQTRIDAEFRAKELALKQAEISAKLQIQNQETETARILKGKEEKKPKKKK